MKIEKKLKFLCHYPTIMDRDSNSMDMKITKFLILLSASGSVLGLFPSDLPNLLSAQVKKSCFLTFHPPPKLHFHEVPAKADRFNLLTLGNPVSQSVDVVVVEDNSTAEVSEFPLTGSGKIQKFVLRDQWEAGEFTEM